MLDLMNIATHILRILLGLFLVMPLLAMTGVIPQPTAEMYSEPGWKFISALMETGYMMPLVSIANIVCGVLLLANRTALAAIMLVPLTINIVLFHVFLDASPISAGAIPAYVLLFGNIIFLYQNRSKYRGLIS